MFKLNFPSNLRQLYIVSFVEGGVVMVTEIAGARLLTPFFGASLYSWAATLSITLLALMIGYYTGGYITTKPRFSEVSKIFWIFFLSGIMVLVMPSLGNFIMRNTLGLPFFAGLLISECFFLFLPIFLMGMISPMIIFHITKKVEESGRSAGNIYAISTSGGILFTLAFGFLILPQFGITLPLKLLGLFVCALALYFLIKQKIARRTISATAIFLFLLSIMSFSQKKSAYFSAKSGMRMIDYSEGLLGELKVVDQLTYPSGASPVTVRKLRANNVQQNFVFADMPSQSLMYYVNFTKQLIQFFPKHESALIVGLGAGSLYGVLTKKYSNVETVEIDKRIYDIGVKYFGMEDHKENNFITDGRYFLNASKKKYDLIVLDVIIGESVPAQLITLESFRKCYELLNKNGTLIIEHGGIHDFSKSVFVPCLAKTLIAAGFEVKLFNPLLSDKIGDALFVATKTKTDLDTKIISDDVLIKGGVLKNYELPFSLFNMNAGRVLTDDCNNAELLLREHYFVVRKSVRKELAGIVNK